MHPSKKNLQDDTGGADAIMNTYQPTENSTMKRHPMFASYDREVIHGLIDAAPYCHVSAQIKGQPYIQATVHWRDGERLYIHGARKNKMIHALIKGAKAAVAFTHFDGYILTRSAFAHGVSYRSVVLFSVARELVALPDKMHALRLFMERISPGRWETVRPPTEEELRMTGLLELEISEVSAKIVMQGEQLLQALPGGQYESPEDVAFAPWTGFLPYSVTKMQPIPHRELVAAYAKPAPQA